MKRIGFIFLMIFLLLSSQSFAAETEGFTFPGLLKSRKVVGVIYFDEKKVDLSDAQKREISRIAVLVSSQLLNDKIVRVEGFSMKETRNTNPLSASFARAKAVWNLLESKGGFDSNNLYLTGFDAKQSLSKLQGERVEIAIYGNPFMEKADIYIRE